MASRVASSLASNSGGPESVQGAHRTLGVASHEGLGRLPAKVVSNMFLPRSIRCACRELQLRPHFGRQDLAESAGRAPLQGAERAAALADRTPALVRAAARSAPCSR